MSPYQEHCITFAENFQPGKGECLIFIFGEGKHFLRFGDPCSSRIIHLFFEESDEEVPLLGGIEAREWEEGE